VDFPSKVTASGSRLRFEDDQQTPDTASAYFDCDGKAILWEAVSWTAPLQEEDAIGMEIRGTRRRWRSTMRIHDLRSES
jgi:hypothetical protein